MGKKALSPSIVLIRSSTIMRSTFAAIALLALVAMPATSRAQADMKMIGGAAMYPTKDIINNAVNSKDHTTLVALPAGTVDNLLKPENKATRTSILTYHVVSG